MIAWDRPSLPRPSRFLPRPSLDWSMLLAGLLWAQPLWGESSFPYSRAPQRPIPPGVHDDAWIQNPIDAFILRELKTNHLTPNPPASKVQLLRRACYDLTGLPPTLEDVNAFLQDHSPQAFDRVVDRLLASPHYGERWARHWLDCVRYGESNSYENDEPKPEVWRYRDYVVDAFNADKPYDRFIREQLAGDELDENTPASIIATGFYRLGIWDSNATDPPQARYDELDDVLSTTGQVFLGLTLNCARCHDHKIDPIPQEDYYRMLAFLHNIRPTVGNMKGLLTKLNIGEEAYALSVQELGPHPPPTFVLNRGNAHTPGQRVEPAYPGVLGFPKPTFPPQPSSAKTTGRRKVLADWIASPQNPLTARVMVNRLWQYHFGRGLVGTPNNFGSGGEPCSHPELLDWLACEFMTRGWSLKEMHRLIMLSQTYRMSSADHESNRGIDPENRLWWRMNMRRLTAEEVRDSMLAVNATLNLALGGPSMYPDFPAEVLATQSRPGHHWGESSAAERHRRSLYIHVKRSLLDPLLTVFDLADPDNSCPVRFSTTQPTQALTLLNGAFVHRQAAHFADRLRRACSGDEREQIRLALRLAFDREPAHREVERGLLLLHRLQQDADAHSEEPLRQFCVAVFNLNEFVFVD